MYFPDIANMSTLPVKELFHRKTTNKSERDANFHWLRCHYQILLWSLINVNVLKLEETEWVWKMQDGIIMPIMTDMYIAP